MATQNDLELFRNLYRAGQEMRQAMRKWRVGQSVHQLGRAVSPSSEVVAAIVKIEQATEAIDLAMVAVVESTRVDT